MRANAVLLVVLTHSAAVLGLPEYFNDELLGGLLSKGAVGVDIFFGVSGFIIIYVALKERTLQPRLPIGQFLVKRFVRIVPFLWVAVIAYAGIRYIGTGDFEPLPYLNSLFLIPGVELRPNVVWSLRHEALFYLLFAVSFLLRRKAPWLLYAWCIAPIVVWGLSFAGVEIAKDSLLDFVLHRSNIFFGVGVLVGMLCQKHGLAHRFEIRSAPLSWVLLIAATVAAFAVRDVGGFWFAALASGVVLIVGVLTPTTRNWFTRIWEELGNASYSIYLTHNIVLLVGATAWVRLFDGWGYAPAIAVLGTLSAAAGVCVHWWVEKPVIRISRTIFERSGTPRTPVSPDRTAK